MNLSTFCKALCAILISHAAHGALAPVQVISVPNTLLSLYGWVELSGSISQKKAREIVAEKIEQNENIDRALLIGATLDQRHGDARTILISILLKRNLFYQGLIGQTHQMYTYFYLSGYRGTGVGFAWGYRPRCLKELAESEDIKGILTILTRDLIDIEVDLLALRSEGGWVDYNLITAYTLIKKYGSDAHKQVSGVLQNRMNFIKTPASKNLNYLAIMTPLFIDSLISAEEYQDTVKRYPTLSLESHDGLLHDLGCFLWELYQHTFIDIDGYIAQRNQLGKAIPQVTSCVKKMLKAGSLIERLATMQSKIVTMLIAEKLGDYNEYSKEKKTIQAILSGSK